jgi:hypothetical protein
VNDFVDRLLGGPEFTAIRPMIPTLFEPVRRRVPDEPLPLGVFSDTTTPIAAAPDPVRSDPSVTPAHAVEIRSVTTPPTPGMRPVHVARPPAQQTIEVNATTQHLHTHHSATTVVDGRRSDDPIPPPAESVTVQHPPAAIVQAPGAAPAGPKAAIDVHHHETVVAGVHVQREPRRRPHTAEPDVHISIGRVEIRTGRDGKAARERTDSRKSPQLSLDDYLRGREVDRR